MDPKLLRSFVVLAEELHYGRAAARLHITQPPLSKHIVQLEEAVGARLFDRNRRGVRLTPAGEAMRAQAQRLLEQARQAIEIVGMVARGDLGRMRIGFNASVLFMNVQHYAQRLQRELPAMRSSWIEMNSSEQFEALRRYELDLGIAQAPPDLPGLQSVEVARIPMVVALPAAHPLAALRAVPLKRLRDEEFVLAAREIGPGFFDLVTSACLQAGFSPRIHHHARHLLTTLSLVATSGGVALVPESMRQTALPGVALRPLTGTDVASSYSLVWNPDHAMPALQRVRSVFLDSKPQWRRQGRT